MHRERLLDLLECLLVGGFLGIRSLELGWVLARARAEPVDATPPRQLADPGPEGIVGAQRVQSLVRPGEHVLEDVFRLVGRQPEALGRDRIDVAGEPLDELAPCVLVARAAAGGQRSVGFPAHMRIVTLICG